MHSNLWTRLTGGARLTGTRLLLSGSAVMSLVVAGHFLTGLNAGDFNSNPAVATHEALSARLLTPATFVPRASVSDLVTKALAFKALLTPAQQATLEQAYTASLARRWSNLPCTNTCRNGIGLGTLNAEQLAAALEVIKAAEGTVGNEGSDEFNQIRLADSFLNANGGGASYGAGNYYLAFLNTPTNTGAWMIQFGGHHYGANIAYNGGHVVSGTPLFEALEPLTFTVNGTTYSPLAQEHDALAAMLASLSTTQLATAKLSQTFGDVTMSPGETNGGNGVFPTTKVGLPVSSLSAAQKQLVLEAMKPWVRDMDDTVAANLLAIYQSELDSTYIAYTGNGTSGDASTFLNANTNYARIDGPGVWIEFACQGGIIFRNQIHYHTVWRDHLRDYGKDLSLTTPLDSSTTAGSVTALSAASFASGSLAAETIGSLFGTGLTTASESAASVPLPTTLAGIQVQVKDSAGTTRNAPLLYASPTQINFQNPAGSATGAATLAVVSNGNTVATGTIVIESVTPGLFGANSNGQGVAAAIAIRVSPAGVQTVEPVIQFNSSTKLYEAVPLTVNSTDQLYLVAFGTGFRNRTSLANVSATLGGVAAQVAYAGAQGSFVGLDQANVLIPASLAGKGDVTLLLTVDGKTANPVTVNIK